MSITPSRRLVNPMLGVYFGIFASLFIAIALMALILEQLGLDDYLLRLLIAGGLAALFAGIAIATRSDSMQDLLFAGRRVPAIFTGLTLTMTVLGGTGLAALPGLLYLIGFDAVFLTVGMTAGLVVFAILIAPYMRKFGAYSLPSYLRMRFASPSVGIVAATVISVPLLLLIVAEFKVALMAGSLLTQLSPLVLALSMSLLVLVIAAAGGLRSVSWTSAAQGVVVMLAVLISVAVIAVLMAQLPIPQLSHGRSTRTIMRMEALQGIPHVIADYFAFDLPGTGLEVTGRRFATPFASIGQGAFLMSILAVMAGVAAQPTLLARVAATPGVYATRKSVGWAICLVSLVFLTMSAVGVFLREVALTEVAGRPAGQLPAWLPPLIAQELASVDTGTAKLTLSSFAIRRDAAMVILLSASQVPIALTYAVIAGLLAAALSAVAISTHTLGIILSEDVILGPRNMFAPERSRSRTLRLSLAAVTIVGCWLAVVVPGDPLELLMWSLALTGSTAFPVLLLSIWWKRCNGWGAMAGLLVGGGVALIALLGGELAGIGLPGPMAAVAGAPAALIASAAVSLLTPAPGRHVLELVRDLRVPGGDTLYDREVRLALAERRRQMGG